jgi:hypothetical protein
MSDEKLNEVGNDNLDLTNEELFNDISSSEPIEKIEESEGPKRIKKEKKEIVVESKIEEIIEKPKALKKEPKIKKEAIKVEVVKTTKDRYSDMLENKNFEVRFKGNMIFDSVNSKKSYSLTDNGIVLNNITYKYSEVVIRMKN